MIERAMRPGMSMAGLAMRNQANANELRRWVKLHRQRAGAAATTAARRLPVTIAAPPPSVPVGTCADRAAPTIEIEPAGAVVRVNPGVKAQQLRIVLPALRACLSVSSHFVLCRRPRVYETRRQASLWICGRCAARTGRLGVDNAVAGVGAFPGAATRVFMQNAL